MIKWYKQDGNADSHPKLQRAGFWGARAFECLCRISAEFEFRGIIPAHHADPMYLARRMMATDVLPLAQAEAEIASGLDRLATTDPKWQLVERREDGSLVLLGWRDERMDSDALSSTERSKNLRRVRELEAELERLRGCAATPTQHPATPELPAATPCNAGPLHATNGDDATLKKRRDIEEEPEPSPLPPAAAGGREIGAPERRGRRRRSRAPEPEPPRELTPAATRVLAAIREASGVPYGPETAGELEARLRGEHPALTEAEALAVVRWAARDRHWGGEVKLKPSVLFAPQRVGELLALARAAERRDAEAAPPAESAEERAAREVREELQARARAAIERLAAPERRRLEERARTELARRGASAGPWDVEREVERLINEELGPLEPGAFWREVYREMGLAGGELREARA